MFVVHNRIDTPAEQAEAFERGFASSMQANLAEVPGLVRSTLMRPSEEGQPYVAAMEFDSRDSFLAWMRSDSFRAAHANADAPGMKAPTNVESFTVVEDVRP